MNKKHDITLTVSVSYKPNDKKLPAPDTFINVYDDDHCKLGSAVVKKNCATLKFPANFAGKFIRIFHASREFDIDESASPARLQRYQAVEKRLLVNDFTTDLRFEFPEFDLTLWTTACCRVRGDVSMRITMPDNKIRFAPLCNARLQIFEIDHTFPALILTLPDHLIYKLRNDWKAAIKTPLKLVNDQPEIFAAAEGIRQTLVTDKKILKLSQPQLAIRNKVKSIFKLNTATRLRKAFIDNFVLLRPYLCFFDWLLHDIDLLKTVDIADDGTFDTHIYYPCFGDKPDLYFKVQQACHPEGWLTVYEPSIHCSTYWDYCCGTNIKIQVTHPRSTPGLSVPACNFTGANNPSVIGESTLLPYDTPFNVAHIALLHTGAVMLIPGHRPEGDVISSTVWNPNNEQIANFDTPLAPNQVTDPLYCCHHVFLADGKLLTIGGGGNSPSGDIKATWIFDPHTKKWTKVKDMKNKRWYPTAVLLDDGRVLAVSGSGVEEVEIYDPDEDQWDVVEGANREFKGLYPGLHMLPSGDVIFTRTGWNAHDGDKSAILHFTGKTAGVWHADHKMKYADHHEGMSIVLIRRHETELLDNVIAANPVALNKPVTYARILVIGGGGDRWGTPENTPTCPEFPAKSVEKIDFPPASGTAAWTDAKDLWDKRCNGNAILLPDGNVLVCGGVLGKNIGCEIYDPDKNIWSKAAALNAERMYHSNALLLPSGKVLIVGGSTADKFKMEIYSPPYLFRGPRPSYTIPEHHIHHNDEFSIFSPDACRIKKIGLMRPSATTHQTDSEQRYILMDFERKNKCELVMRAPENGAIAPPGYYMLFVVDDCGVPSKAKFINIH